MTEQINNLPSNDPEYVRLVTQISDLWENAKNKAALAVNTELLDANWLEKSGHAVTAFSQNKVVNLSH